MSTKNQNHTPKIIKKSEVSKRLQLQRKTHKKEA